MKRWQSNERYYVAHVRKDAGPVGRFSLKGPERSRPSAFLTLPSYVFAISPIEKWNNRHSVVLTRIGPLRCGTRTQAGEGFRGGMDVNP